MPTSTIASSPLRYRNAVPRQRSADPFPPPPPSKPIDLNSSTRSTDKETGQKVTRRAFLLDVVVENQGEETANLLSHLGNPLKPLSIFQSPATAKHEIPNTPSRLSLPPRSEDTEAEGPSPGWSGPRKEEMSIRLNNLIEELVKTERSYLSRIHALKTLIPQYEAKAMFANIEAIVPASAAFMTDLDAMLKTGQAEDVVGDVCLKHLKTLRTFDPYRTYLSKQDESQKLFQDSLKKFNGFASFIESTKYQTTGIGNIGLRELLMEPVQRIPRYTLLWQTRCEPDPQTVRATVMYHLERNIDDFPAKLFNSNRDFIDSIDVEDLPAEYPTASSPPSRPLSSLGSRPLSISSSSNPSMASFGSLTSQSPPTIHSAATALNCTLFLFDDKLMIVKRQSSSISGRKTIGTDDIQKLVRGVAIMDKNAVKKDKLSCRGVVDVLDIIASDTGRWAARPFRSYSTVHPPYSVALDPVATRRDKLRFIHNLWAAQALARAKVQVKDNRAIPKVLMNDQELSLEVAGEAMGRARCYWNVWDRNGYSDGFKFKTGTTSCPTTPSATSHRLRPSMLNLDAISRNLFGAGSVSGRSDMFSTKASRSTGSRSSTLDLSDDFSHKRLVHRSSSPSDGLTKVSVGLLAGAPYQADLGQSEVDLNARLNLARSNSKSVAVNINQGTKSVSELRQNVEERSMNQAEASLRATSTTPLRIRKSPSPVRAFSPTMDATPKSLSTSITSHRTSTVQSMIAKEDVFTSPRQLSSPPPITMSPRPAGPRNPVSGASFSPSHHPAVLSTIGSAHTRLRIVSGGGRRISVGRETVPLKDCDDDESPGAQSTPTLHITTKRQHSTDNLTPRKRSPPRSPLRPRNVSGSSNVSEPTKPGSRRASGKLTPRRTSGPLTNTRTVSASQNSVTSAVSNTTVEDIEMDECRDVEAALEATSKKRIVDHEAYDSISSRHSSSGKQEIDAIVMDECARGITSIVERVDGHLRQAEASSNQATTLARRLISERDQAFNTELDGMFDDAQLPETEAFVALKKDLQASKASRNQLELENKKLKRELEEANLKRDQWARMLQSQGYKL
ncbi:uncharacterized protein L201_006298 [Kwoniella dendrophila CBS 6074]|uniref:DH domain-containing protein n=1 Tax=Kwoniella dendrophila CBS 6074 TaxID=1295534 RepID=A0AAX4K3L2_9TREE